MTVLDGHVSEDDGVHHCRYQHQTRASAQAHKGAVLDSVNRAHVHEAPVIDIQGLHAKEAARNINSARGGPGHLRNVPAQKKSNDILPATWSFPEAQGDHQVAQSGYMHVAPTNNAFIIHDTKTSPFRGRLPELIQHQVPYVASNDAQSSQKVLERIDQQIQIHNTQDEPICTKHPDINKDAITESGMGQSCYPVINDYITSIPIDEIPPSFPGIEPARRKSPV